MNFHAEGPNARSARGSAIAGHQSFRLQLHS
jgi:hypothetical protein